MKLSVRYMKSPSIGNEDEAFNRRDIEAHRVAAPKLLNGRVQLPLMNCAQILLMRSLTPTFGIAGISSMVTSSLAFSKQPYGALDDGECKEQDKSILSQHFAMMATVRFVEHRRPRGKYVEV